MICTYCQSSIDEITDDVLICNKCDSLYHKECWEEAKICGTYGCLSTQCRNNSGELFGEQIDIRPISISSEELNFEIYNNVLIKYYGNSRIVNIPENVFSIGRNAFVDNNNIEEIFISKNVNNIMSYVFDNCLNLKKIRVTDENPYFSSRRGVLYDKKLHEIIRVPIAFEGEFAMSYRTEIIGQSAFSFCKVNKLDLSRYKIINIAPRAFFGCRELNVINFPKTLERIECFAFSYCESLKSVFLPYKTVYDSHSFMSYCNINREPLKIINSTIVSNNANTNRTNNINVTSNITNSINNNLQLKHNKITESIPDKLIIKEKSIDENVNDFYVEKYIRQIHIYAFDLCKKLKYINVDINNMFYASVFGILYNKDKTKLIRVPINYQDEIKISTSTNTIGNSAFSFCLINSINFDRECCSKITNIEEFAFWGCENLKEVILSKNIKKIGRNAFGNCKNLDVIKCYKNTVIDFQNGVDIEYLNE